MTLTERIAKALNSPQVKQLTDRAKRMADDPATRRRIEQLRTRLTGKR
jgi:hypothetical protein